MGDESGTTGGRGHEQLIRAELNIKADVAGKIVRAVNTLSSLIQTELESYKEESFLMLTNPNDTSMGITVESTKGGAIMFRPVDLLTTETGVHRFEYRNDLTETFITFTPEGVLIGSDTEQSRSPDFHSLNAEVWKQTLMVKSFNIRDRFPIVLHLPIAQKPGTPNTISAMIDTDTNIGTIKDIVEVVSDIGAFADYVLSNEWVVDRIYSC